MPEPQQRVATPPAVIVDHILAWISLLNEFR
jgi:hypothetical protein